MRQNAASIRIQKYGRGRIARKFYTGLQGSAIIIQSGLRAMAAWQEYGFQRRSKAATVVQTEWRRFKALSTYRRQKQATLTFQCLWRMKSSRKELKKLRMAARETGALKEAKDKLEKWVEELKWRLEFEKHLRIDLEEAKKQEVGRLQNALEDMRAQLDKAQEAIAREREAAKLAIEQAPPVIKEIPVVDETKLELLRCCNKELEGDLNSLRKKVEEFEEK
ncbi:hypothetical protein CRG98_020728 [Punica granatum]|nr:hypothetical protein CRG98_020728 [Punica granatum]